MHEKFVAAGIFNSGPTECMVTAATERQPEPTAIVRKTRQLYYTHNAHKFYLQIYSHGRLTNFLNR